MSSQYKLVRFFVIFIICSLSFGCAKLVRVPEPVNSITSTETFETDATATSAVVGIYDDIVTGAGGSGYQVGFGNGLISIDAGMSADELHLFGGASAFETNTLNNSNFPGGNFWNGPYYDIYLANAAVEGLANSSGASIPVRNELTGEAKFLRSFCYFYLVNLFGNVPLALTAAYAKTDTLSRAPDSLVYQQIVTDLLDARKLLPGDYSVANGDRVRVNRLGAAALLSRVYLYTKQWRLAEMTADTVINNGAYRLVGLDSIFLANSSEAILQWQLQQNVYPYAAPEENVILPPSPTDPPGYYFTDQLLGSFEAGDRRRAAWVDSSFYMASTYYYPYKYKLRVGVQGIITECPMVLRLAEQYLIRAEARAQQSNLSGAINDLNIIRARAGLSDLSPTLTQTEVMAAIMQERKIELCAEWGNRWFDLKRTGQAISVLSADKGFAVPAYQLLYPIPPSEITNDVNLVQNPQY